MTLFDPAPDPGDPARLRSEAQRTCDRLRTMSLPRLDVPLSDGRSRARAAVELAQDLADSAAALAGRPRRALPELAASASGDILAVCAADLADEMVRRPGEASSQAGRDAVAGLVQLRHHL